MALSNRVVINIFCVTAFFWSCEVSATDDEYLKMLEGEAAGATLDQSGQLKAEHTEDEASTEGTAKKYWKWEGALDGDVLPAGLAQKEFAELLKNDYYGSFVFYRKLNSNDKKTVYYNYTQASAAHVETIRQDILGHLKR